jgi:putative ABC transport system permease protein
MSPAVFPHEAAGICGVVSCAVTGRSREIGVRLGLGATARNVFSLVLHQTMRPVVIGTAIGIAVASALSRVLSSVLFGVSAADPIGLGGGALLVLAVALAEDAIVTRPATRSDPTALLR